MQHRKFGFVGLVLLLVLAVASPAFAQGNGPVAPLLGRDEPGAIAGRYIVVFKDGVGPGAADETIGRLAGGQVLHRYTAALNGFAAELPEQAIQGLLHNPNVAYIEVDQVVTIDADTTQTGATWGLDRIDQRGLPLSTTYTYNYTGAGVTAYIIDTGINSNHNEFTGRILPGYDAVDGGAPDDCNGHGTHVAGTVGGQIYGVAKGVNLVAVRVLNCSGSGTTTGVIAGVDWVTKYHAANSVANMSLGGGLSTALDTAVNNSINAGVTYAVAAGNSNRDACKFSPARVPAAITVGATTSTDARASYSNYGACLDIFAPGSSITSAWIDSDDDTHTISGTSMATPHVAGAAALYKQANPGATPLQVRNALVGGATVGVVGNEGRNSPDLLLYTLFFPQP